jgi:hypothetical protein
VFPVNVEAADRIGAARLLIDVEAGIAQPIVNEWARRIAGHEILSRPLSYSVGLVGKLGEGKFVPTRASHTRPNEKGLHSKEARASSVDADTLLKAFA